MKYKVGDKVRIKTWKQMEKEFGIRPINCIDTSFGFIEDMEEELNLLNCDRNLTIEHVIVDNGISGSYKMKEMECWNWGDSMIECLAKNHIVSISIENRWEILDL